MKPIVRVGKPRFFLDYGCEYQRCAIENVQKKIKNGWKMRFEAQCLSEHPDEKKLDSSRTIRSGRISGMERRKGVWIVKTPNVDYYYLVN